MGGGADDEARFDDDAAGGERFGGLDGFKEQAGRGLADLGAALVDGGEGDAEEIGVMDVAGADDGEVGGDVEAGVEDGFHGAGGDGVVVAEDAVGAGAKGEEAHHGLVAGDVVVAGGEDVIGAGFDAGVAEGAFEAFEAAGAGGGGGAVEMGDAAAALLDQVIGGEFADGGIVDADEVRVGAGGEAIDEDVGAAVAVEECEEVGGVGGATGGEDEAVDAAFEE